MQINQTLSITFSLSVNIKFNFIFLLTSWSCSYKMQIKPNTKYFYFQATKAGMRGMFRAFLASNERFLENIVRYTDRDLPVVNLRGEILFNAWSDIFRDKRLMFSLFYFLSDSKFVCHRETVFSQDRILYSFNGENVLNSTRW